jgi:archaellum component FlaG (FlaF/FlaG flagellin family)
MSKLFSYLSWFSIVLIMVALMSGILSLVRELLLLYAPEKFGGRIRFWRCVWIAFILSSIILWAVEHSQNMDLHNQIAELNNPELQAKINVPMRANFSYGPNQQSHTEILTLMVTIKNSGSPSIATLDNASFVLRDGRHIDPRVVMPSGKDWFLPGEAGMPDVTLPDADYLPRKTINNPIPKGGAAYGWIMYSIPATLTDQDVTGATITLQFSDVNGKPFTATATLQPHSYPKGMFNPATP